MTDEKQTGQGPARVPDQVIGPQEMQIINISDNVVDVEREVNRIEKDIALYNKIKQVALKLSKISDWVNMGGAPYLMDRGTENIGIAFGVDITQTTLTQEWNEDLKGRYYTYIAKGKAFSRKLGRTIEDFGICSQRDKFFGFDSATKTWRLVEDVDMANIRRKAMTNLYNRLIKRVVGLMNVTMEDLAGIGWDVKQIKTVEYQAGSARREATMTDDAKKMRTDLADMLMMLANGDKKQADQLLEKYSAWESFEDKDGKKVKVPHKATSISQLTEKWMVKVYEKVKVEFDKVSAGPKQEDKQEREPGVEG